MNYSTMSNGPLISTSGNFSKIVFNFLLICFTVLILTGCRIGDNGGSSDNSDTMPNGLTYTLTAAVYTKNIQIIENKPSYNGTVTGWQITPNLPEGLVLDPVTGIISGTPLYDQDSTKYTITASNSYGSATADILITVKDVPPSVLTYSTTAAVYTIDTEIAENIPSFTGSVDTWSVTPDLPAGLTLNTLTGVITGKPVAVQKSVNYTVTASNSEGSASTVISIAVNIASPTSLTYSTTSAIYTTGLAIKENTPTYYGTVTSWSVTPELPEGLTLDSFTGKITGTPVSIQSAADYTITASNEIGSVSTVISITVDAPPPSELSYANMTAVYTVNKTITSNVPGYKGTVTSWTVTPDLPAGLILNKTTGVISGIPTTAQGIKVYTVTASNLYGSTSADISITVNLEAPSGLTYSSPSSIYTMGVGITRNIPSVKGTVTSWTVTPNLPAGLTLNTTTGVISGVPEAIQDIKKYTVTASNSQGSVSAGLSIKINYPAPAGLSYSPSPVILGIKVYFFGSWILFPTEITITPTYTGYVTTWSIDKALPSGITLNPTTGVISGKGTAARGSVTTYIVTASNNGGSASATVIIKGP